MSNTMISRGSRGVCAILQEVSCAFKRNYAKMEVAPLQKALLQELCILVDEQDKPVGEATKEYSHRVAQDGSIPLHRAFSVFLFNNNGDLLVQKRSPTKITFPEMYTNTCCSHPSAKNPGEAEEDNALGIKKAARRRLADELGIPVSEVQPTDFNYLTRIHYYASSDGYWGEHEIDYILFLQKDKVSLDPNPDEVSEIRWVPRDQIEKFVKEINAPLTPWFKLILNNKLLYWWDNLKDLDKLQDHSTIHRF
ncbi:isopentenyl-diphosphate Delta-isomerase 1 [Cephus cinctus]|uniref:isopentenyl-diphosphate Delta-isomerase n=1 Tax=Cephus cinctus TaxID=211228 RepID=A0AAJ7BPG8_CEPCN|nr:isopentenyl-diphosphate Delta-isomerase 1 [Cephus cinctus]